MIKLIATETYLILSQSNISPYENRGQLTIAEDMKMNASVNAQNLNSFIFNKELIYIVGLAAILLIPSAYAQESSAQEQLLLPDDLEVSNKNDNVIQEHWVGGRLERLTIRRNNGLTEIYQNNRSDTLWYSEEENLGDLQNVRQWKLGSW